MDKYLAKANNIGIIGGGEGFGGYGTDTFDQITFGARLSTIVSNVIGIMTMVGGIYFIFMFIIGAYGVMTASGNKDKLQQAQNRILYAVIGLVILVAAYGLISVIGTLLGLDILNPQSIIDNLVP